MDKNIFRKIKKVRIKLEKAISQTGLNSQEVRKLSDEMDILINEYEKSVKIVEYPKNSSMLEWYKISYAQLKEITGNFKRFPTTEEWNMYAKNKNLLSHASLEYISKLNWNYLRTKVERELKFNVIKK